MGCLIPRNPVSNIGGRGTNRVLKITTHIVVSDLRTRGPPGWSCGEICYKNVSGATGVWPGDHLRVSLSDRLSAVSNTSPDDKASLFYRSLKDEIRQFVVSNDETTCGLGQTACLAQLVKTMFFTLQPAENPSMQLYLRIWNPLLSFEQRL